MRRLFFSGQRGRNRFGAISHFGQRIPTVECVYADDYARMSYETATAVRKLMRDFPADLGNSVPLERIRFATQDEDRGYTVLLFTGDYMLTDEHDEELHFVQPRTRRILDALKVKYDRVSPRVQGC